MNTRQLQREAAAYANASEFLKEMREYKGRLSQTDEATIRKIALSGDVPKARKWMQFILARDRS